MTVYDFLESPLGVQLVHAVIVLLLAVTGWVSYKTKKQSESNAKALDGHIESHKILTDVEHDHNQL